MFATLLSGAAVLNIRAEVRLTEESSGDNYYMTNSGAWNIPQTYIGTNLTGASERITLKIKRDITDNNVNPFTGAATVRVRVFLPWRSTTNGTFSRMSLYSISAIYGVGSSGTPPLDELDYENFVENDAQALDLQIMHGSGTDEISERSFRLSDNTAALLWNRRGFVENRKTWDILSTDILDLYSSNNEVITGTFRGIMQMYNKINTVINSVTYSYAVNGFRWKVKSRENIVTLTKIDAASYTNTTTTKQLPAGPINEGPPPSGGGGGGSSESEEMTSGSEFNISFP